jgi:hypothetical protein
MIYDPRWLRLAGLIRRLPRSNQYVHTAEGIQIAVFYTKVYNRLLPLTAVDQPSTCRPAHRPSPPAPRRVKLDMDVKSLATKDRKTPD